MLSAMLAAKCPDTLSLACNQYVVMLYSVCVCFVELRMNQYMYNIEYTFIFDLVDVLVFVCVCELESTLICCTSPCIVLYIPTVDFFTTCT